MPEGTKNALLSFLEHPLTWMFGSGGAGALLNHWSNKRKVRAEALQGEAQADATVSDAAMRVTARLEDQIKSLWLKYEEMLSKYGALMDRYGTLEREHSKLSEKFLKMSSRVSRLLIINDTLRAYIRQMTRRDGDPAIPPMLLEDIDFEDDDETDEKVGQGL